MHLHIRISEELSAKKMDPLSPYKHKTKFLRDLHHQENDKSIKSRLKEKQKAPASKIIIVKGKFQKSLARTHLM